MGVRAEAKRDVLQDSLVQILRVDRGGEATYHGPGQLLVFPSTHLPTQGFTVRGFVGLLLDVTVELLRNHQIESSWSEKRPGVFTERGKIAAVGLKIAHGWSRHGLALNVNGDVGPFSQIRACGVKNAALDQMASWPFCQNLDLKTLGEEWETIFRGRLAKFAHAPRLGAFS